MDANARSPEPDPWEEEIDLRELFAGVLGRWHWWVGIPLVVTLLAAGYFLTQPDRYQIRTQFFFDHTRPGVGQLDLRFLPPSVVEQKLYSVSLVGPSFRRTYPARSSDSTPVLSFMESVEFERVTREEGEERRRPIQVYRLSLTTSDPDSASRVLNAWMGRFQSWSLRWLRNRLNVLEASHRQQLETVREDWSRWKKQLSESVGGGLPGFEATGGQPDGSPGTSSSRRDFIPSEVELLQRNQQFLEETSELSRKLAWCRQLLESPGDLLRYYPAEPPGTPVETNPWRNTVLAGAVSFLLTFFAVTFWEIL